MRPNDRADLDFLARLFEAGRLEPLIDRQFALSEVPEALRYLDDVYARGKVVITM